MASKREQVIEAVHALCATIPLVRVERNRERPTKIPPEGLIIVRDGEVGPPEVLLPLSYLWTHAIRVEVYSQSGNADGHVDELLAALGTALATDRTLGGLAEDMRADAPEFDVADPEGAPGAKAASVTIRVTYETAGALA